jgi:ferredoxin
MAKLSMYQLYQLLPKTDCERCGFSCMGFANRLISRDVKPEDCPLLLESAFEMSLNKLNELLGPDIEREITGLLFDPDRCNGCGICVIVCEVNMEKSEDVDFGRAPGFSDEVVLRVEDGKVKLVDPYLCMRTNPSAHICRACAELCPTGAIRIA